MARPEYPSDKQDQYMVRFPAGMRDRIKKSAERNGRSMNAEIVKALETYFPPEPTVEEVLDRVHSAIETAQSSRGVPYRTLLLQALNDLSERLSSGIEFDQFRSTLPPAISDGWPDVSGRILRWRRAQEVGVEQSDLEREIAKGLLRDAGGDVVRSAIQFFERGRPDRALRLFRLQDVKFADPEAAHKAIEADLRKFYEENWGDINDVPPWEASDE